MTLNDKLKWLKYCFELEYEIGNGLKWILKLEFGPKGLRGNKCLFQNVIFILFLKLVLF